MLGGQEQVLPDELVARALDISAASLRRYSDPISDLSRPLRDADKLLKWEPWVRVQLGQQELLAGLYYRERRLWVVDWPSGATPKPALNSTALIGIDGPGEPVPDEQLQSVLRRMGERVDRLPEILVQQEHLWPFWTSVTGISPSTSPRTAELLQVALCLSPAIGMRFKHDINCSRPGEVSAAIKPVIEVPGHASLPSGHATAASMYVHIFDALLGLEGRGPVYTHLVRQAVRIADNRVVAGLHYPMDNAAGWELGRTLGRYVIARCKGGTVEAGLQFSAAKFGAKEFDVGDNGSPKTWTPAKADATVEVSQSGLLGDLWRLAATELHGAAR